MKRLAPLLILGALLLGLFGVRAGQAQANLRIRSCTPGCPQLAVYLPCEELAPKGDRADKLLSAVVNFAFNLNPSWENAPLSDRLRAPSPNRCSWLGLGCGGLPA